MKNSVKTNNEILSRIVRHLILDASFTRDIGLYHGKMGIVLFFAHYGRYTGNSLYDDFAGELLDEIYEDIHAGTSIDFENGLCGIGWGIEYLLQNGFMEGDSDEVLSEIDQKIMERNIRRITDTSFRTGLGGISCYIRKRNDSPGRNRQKKPFDETYLKEWKAIAQDAIKQDDSQLLISIMDTLPEGDDILSWKLGLENGCAGFGLTYLMSNN
ncbi:MAG: hypothetical protein LBN11_01850 [Tannerella sp.]|jgi:lantibiotic modifying enzyme|nr:hypothetical protein [Tannerella sp.]